MKALRDQVGARQECPSPYPGWSSLPDEVVGMRFSPQSHSRCEGACARWKEAASRAPQWQQQPLTVSSG